MSLSLDSTDAQASFYANQEVMGKELLTPEEKMKMIDKVSIHDIKKVAEDIFKNGKLNLSVIGQFNEKDKDRLLQLLKI